ncbi:MAG: hypothetical protein AAGA56_09055, partial [Myxococcota bacterium]
MFVPSLTSRIALTLAGTLATAGCVSSTLIPSPVPDGPMLPNQEAPPVGSQADDEAAARAPQPEAEPPKPAAPAGLTGLPQQPGPWGEASGLNPPLSLDTARAKNAKMGDDGNLGSIGGDLASGIIRGWTYAAPSEAALKAWDASMTKAWGAPQRRANRAHWFNPA